MAETAASAPLKFMEPSFEEWQSALSSILFSIVEHRSAPEAAIAGERRLIQATPFAWTSEIPTREHSTVLKLAKSPIAGALVLALQFAGKGLFHLGGTAAMRKALESAAGSRPEQAGKLLRIADRAWDGIGTETDMWRA